MNQEQEIKVRTEWEIIVSIGERLGFLVENLADGMPETQRKQAQRLAEHLKDTLVLFQDQACDILESAGIEYSKL